jgi:hypothetical protein
LETPLLKDRRLAPAVPGAQQTSATVFDIDGDHINDIVITERTTAPGVVWLRRTQAGWDRYVIDVQSP